MTELESSKSFQTELSADSAELQSDLRKAYREIVSLQNNLSESKLMIEELENTKKSFYQITDGILPPPKLLPTVLNPWRLNWIIPGRT